MLNHTFTEVVVLHVLQIRGEYFPLGCDNHHGIVSKFDQISEKFLFQKSKKSVTFEKTVKKNPDFHILFGLITVGRKKFLKKKFVQS